MAPFGIPTGVSPDSASMVRLSECLYAQTLHLHLGLRPGLLHSATPHLPAGLLPSLLMSAGGRGAVLLLALPAPPMRRLLTMVLLLLPRHLLLQLPPLQPLQFQGPLAPNRGLPVNNNGVSTIQSQSLSGMCMACLRSGQLSLTLGATFPSLTLSC